MNRKEGATQAALRQSHYIQGITNVLIMILLQKSTNKYDTNMFREWQGLERGVPSGQQPVEARVMHAGRANLPSPTWRVSASVTIQQDSIQFRNEGGRSERISAHSIPMQISHATLAHQCHHYVISGGLFDAWTELARRSPPHTVYTPCKFSKPTLAQ
jgi:hypothetical protein